MIVFNAIMPIFGFILLGFFFRKTHFLSEEIFQGMNRLVYYVALPALLFYKTVTLESITLEIGGFFYSFAGATLLTLLASLLGSYLIRLPAISRGAFIQASFRGNLAFVGLPVVLYYVQTILHKPEFVAPVLLLVSPMVVLYNFLAVLTLLWSKQRFEVQQLGFIFVRITTNPLIIGGSLGLIGWMIGFKTPIFLGSILESLGQMVAPLSLIAVGGAIRFGKIKAGKYRQFLPPVFKILVNPFFGWWLAGIFGVTGGLRVSLLLFLVAPTAAASVVLSDQMGHDTALTANSVLWSTLGAFVVMASILTIFS